MPLVLSRSLTIVLALSHLFFCLAWIFPLHGTPTPGGYSTLQAAATLFPIWATGFGVTSTLLWLSLKWRRLAPWGHGVGAVFVLTYGSGYLFATFTHSNPSVLAPVCFIAIGAIHVLCQRAYRRGVR